MKCHLRYEKGLAFVVEGKTESVFYEEYLTACCLRHGLRITRNDKTQENSFIIEKSDGIVMVMINNVSTVTQMTNSATWLQRACFDTFDSMPWHVFLCYDTDNYDCDITKFYEDDWLRLRETIQQRAASVTDLAIRADIEDVMLCDYPNILSFLGLDATTEMPSGRKGKTKMKKLFRMVAVNNAYHEGEKARRLIQALDMSIIKAKAPIPLKSIDELLGFD